jgi:hypothetical protein
MDNIFNVITIDFSRMWTSNFRCIKFSILNNELSMGFAYFERCYTLKILLAEV